MQDAPCPARMEAGGTEPFLEFRFQMTGANPAECRARGAFEDWSPAVAAWLILGLDRFTIVRFFNARDLETEAKLNSEVARQSSWLNL
jgi:hypothetical protein